MMKIRKHWLRWSMISLLAMAMALIAVIPPRAEADSSSTPTGLNFPDDYFKGTTAGIVTAAAGTKFQLYNINENVGEFQSIWTNQPNFSLKRSSSLGFWVRMPKVDATTGKDDGMAFVLAKSNAKLLSDSGDSGETLGVYADPKKFSSTSSANTAIQNSWAIEFDVHQNEDGGWFHSDADGNYDYNSTSVFPHAAYSYPGDPNTYTKTSTTLWNNIVSVVHHKIVTIPEGSWFHVSVKYDKSTNRLLYAIDDSKNGVVPALTSSNATATIDANDLKSKLNVSDDSNLYFGFTSANSLNSGW
jgi:hypothetical protein